MQFQLFIWETSWPSRFNPVCFFRMKVLVSERPFFHRDIQWALLLLQYSFEKIFSNYFKTEDKQSVIDRRNEKLDEVELHILFRVILIMWKYMFGDGWRKQTRKSTVNTCRRYASLLDDEEEKEKQERNA